MRIRQSLMSLRSKSAPSRKKKKNSAQIKAAAEKQHHTLRALASAFLGFLEDLIDCLVIDCGGSEAG